MAGQTPGGQDKIRQTIKPEQAQMISRVKAVVVAALVASPAISWAQVTPPAPAAAPVALRPAVGSVAPDFTLPGVTRYGLLRAPIRLSDYRGQTVVLAFFSQARTRG